MPVGSATLSFVPRSELWEEFALSRTGLNVSSNSQSFLLMIVLILSHPDKSHPDKTRKIEKLSHVFR